MVSHLHITNKTPYDTVQKYNHVLYSTHGCSDEERFSLAAGKTWFGTSRSSQGGCLVERINVTLTLPDGRGDKECHMGESATTTTNSDFFILMKGDDACCVSSRIELKECP